MTIESFIQASQKRVDTHLNHYLPATALEPTYLHQAMHYAVLNGGKRIRPALIYAMGQALDYNSIWLDKIACSIELIHAYSLVHDDLPALDNARLRRGKPSCHIQFGEDMAIIAADGLQSLAFELLSDYDGIISARQQLQLVKCLAQAIGSLGMVGGQALDMQIAHSPSPALRELERMHLLKTGALIEACTKMVMIVAKVTDPELIQAIEHYTRNLGLAFQIQDDILDVEGDTKMLGKQTGIDAEHNKTTYVTLLGLEAAKQKLNALCLETQSILAAKLNHPLLDEFIDLFAQRKV